MRGDIVRLPAPRAARGREQRGARYGVVVQSDDLQLLSTAVVVPTSRGGGPASYRPEIDLGGSVTRVQPQYLRSIDRSLLGEPVGHVRSEEMREVDEALRVLLDLPRGRD